MPQSGLPAWCFQQGQSSHAACNQACRLAYITRSLQPCASHACRYLAPPHADWPSSPTAPTVHSPSPRCRLLPLAAQPCADACPARRRFRPRAGHDGEGGGARQCRAHHPADGAREGGAVGGGPGGVRGDAAPGPAAQQLHLQASRVEGGLRKVQGGGAHGAGCGGCERSHSLCATVPIRRQGSCSTGSRTCQAWGVRHSPMLTWP